MPETKCQFLFVDNPDGTIFSLSPVTTVIMKLILLLVAIYSLIFYQHYKIEKSKISLPESEQPKAGKSYQKEGGLKQQDFGSASYLIRSHYSLARELPIARLGFYE